MWRFRRPVRSFWLVILRQLPGHKPQMLIKAVAAINFTKFCKISKKSTKIKTSSPSARHRQKFSVTDAKP